MPSRSKRKSHKQFMPPQYIIAFIFAVGFSVLGLVFLSVSQAANPSVAITGIGGKCLDNYQSKKVDSNKIDLFGCNGSGAQKWSVNGNASTSGTIVNSNGYCLGLNSSTANFTHVILYHCDGLTTQQWYYNSANGRITNKASNTCLDDYHSVTTNGNQIDIFTCNNTSAQKWHYSVNPTVKISSPSSGATVNGSSALISASASIPADSIKSLTLIANGSTLRTCTNATTCFVGWNTTSVPNGTYTLQAHSVATGGGSATVSESVKVSNATPTPPPPPPPTPNPSPSPSPSPSPGPGPSPSPNPNPNPNPTPSPNPGTVPSPSPTPFTGSGSGSSVNISPNPTPTPGLNNGQTDNNGGTVDLNNGTTTTASGNGAPLVANIQATSITSSSVTLSWDGSNANSYTLKYGTDSKKLDNSRTIASTDAVPTYTLSKLPRGTTIYIEITPSSDTATGAAVQANFKTKSPGNAAAAFLWIFLSIIIVFVIIFFLIRRRLTLESSTGDPDLAIPLNAPLYPREDSQHESERLNWWMPEEQRHEAAQHPGEQHNTGDEYPDMYEEGRKRLDDEDKDKQ